MPSLGHGGDAGHDCGTAGEGGEGEGGSGHELCVLELYILYYCT